MKKFYVITVMLFVSLVIVHSAFADCVFPDNPNQPAPTWVCSDLGPENFYFSGYPYVSAGMAKKSVLGAYHDKDMAVFEAKNRLAGRIRTVATSSIKRYLAVIGADSSVIDKYVELTAIQFTHTVIEDCPVLATAVSAKGAIYVLVGINKAVGDKIALDELKSSFKNHKAQYQRELGRAAFNSLEKRIKKAEDNPEIMSDTHYSKENAKDRYIKHPKTGEPVLILTEDEVKKIKETKEKE